MSLGKSKSKSSSSSSPLFGGGTQYSRVETLPGAEGVGGTGLFSKLKAQKGGLKRVILDPSIRGLQESGINTATQGQQGFRDSVGQFGSSLGELKSRLFTNQDPYLQARTSATEERFAGERGALQRDIGRRNIGGSSFGQQAQTLQATTQERELNNQRALATQESIEAGVSIDQLILQAKEAESQGDMSLANLLRGVAQDRAQVEVGLLTATTSQSSGKSSGFNVGIPSGGGGGGGGNSGMGGGM